MKIRESLIRTYVTLEKLSETIAFYEALFEKKCHLRFDYPERGLKLAAIGSVLIIAGSKEVLKLIESTVMTCHVDDIEAIKARLVAQGAEILEDIKTVPTGVNLRVKHPDGLIVEYVEHTKKTVGSRFS